MGATGQAGPPPATTDELLWRRDPRWLHRLVPGSALLAAPGGHQRSLGGAAVAVWVVLEAPGTDREIAERVNSLWPENEISLPMVDQALHTMHEVGVIEPVPWHDTCEGTG